MKNNIAGVTSPAAAKLNWIKSYFGVCRLWASTCVPSFRVYPLTLTVIGPRRGGFSVHFPFAIVSPSFPGRLIKNG